MEWNNLEERLTFGYFSFFFCVSNCWGGIIEIYKGGGWRNFKLGSTIFNRWQKRPSNWPPVCINESDTVYEPCREPSHHWALVGGFLIRLAFEAWSIQNFGFAILWLLLRAPPSPLGGNGKHVGRNIYEDYGTPRCSRYPSLYIYILNKWFI